MKIFVVVIGLILFLITSCSTLPDCTEQHSAFVGQNWGSILTKGSQVTYEGYSDGVIYFNVATGWADTDNEYTFNYTQGMTISLKHLSLYDVTIDPITQELKYYECQMKEKTN